MTLQLFTAFHLNLAFSSIDAARRPAVVAQCYTPLLTLADRPGVRLGIELSGYTLRWLQTHAPEWVAGLQARIAAGRVEVIGSGRAQVIGPLVPARVNAANLAWGLHDLQEVLGVRPTTLLVHEQAYSRSLVAPALDAGYRTLVLEWENAWRANPHWDRRLALAPQRVGAQDGREMPIVWNSSIAFQKVQRFAHGEIELDEVLAWIDARRGPARRALCLYGSDAEVFDFRPGRFANEAALDGSEWERLGTLFSALAADPNTAFALPRELDGATFPDGNHLVEPQSAAEPIPTKKQGKYNVTRWAVTGRDDLGINTACERIAADLAGVPLTDPRWQELCDLWASDFRTHITDARWDAFRQRLDAITPPGPPTPPAPVPDPHPSGVAVEAGRRFLTIETPGTHIRLDTFKGICLDALRFSTIGPRILAGTIGHGTLDDVRWSADWFSGHLVFEAPGRPKVTDLERVSPEICVARDAVVVRARVPTRLGPVEKEIRVSRWCEQVTVHFTLHWPELPVGSLRLGHLLLRPDAWEPTSLWYRTHLGGELPETFRCGDLDFDHGDPVSFLVSASTALGMTEGVLDLGDAHAGLRIQTDRTACAAVGSITHRIIGKDRFFRFCSSLAEMDETSRPATAPRAPIRYGYSISPIPGAPPPTGRPTPERRSAARRPLTRPT